jgi:subtilisin family serine protease
VPPRTGRGALGRAPMGSRASAATALVAAATLIASLPTVTTSASAAPAPDRERPLAGPPVQHRVTLVTGDVVRVSTGADGRESISLEPHLDGSVPEAAITRSNGHVFVVPTVAFGLLATHRLDRDLFDVTALIDAEYDDASRPSIPLIVDYGRGAQAAAESRSASFAAARRSLTVPMLGVAAFRADKERARAFWQDLTTRDADGTPAGLADGAVRVDLDGRVEASLEHSVPQIHAPEVWDAGFDGAGTTVAVLDTGYDPTHPDLQGKVTEASNFTADADVVDGNGHGTHVASTVAGTGAASGQLRRGVAPGADLLVGKVLGNDGWGEDSWVLAGMQWAVRQQADVISMSLGGDPDDGSHPLSRAIDELSATSDSLFVVAAGNTGPDASTVSSPGSADAALTVGAVDRDDVMAPFSSRGPRLANGGLKPEVVAPGVDITAARAAGTDIGPAVGEHYTTISGTSMATPHVAGLAALLKQQHPGWDGERLKSAIATSTVPVADATAFDAGTGRIDALRAMHADVLAPATLSAGAFRWPYADAGPTSTPLRYTNTTGADVVLDLSLAGQDGSPVAPGTMSLSADQLVVPANGEATVSVTVDPSTGDPGSYSGVVTATTSDDRTVRTAVGYVLEPELYDLTVRVEPRAGTQKASHRVSLNSLGEPWSYDERTFDAAPGTATATFRVPPGRYSTGAFSFGLAADGAREGVVTYEPQITVDGDRTIVLDENDTGRVRYRVDRPVVDDNATMHVAMNDGVTELLLAGVRDRVYVRPSAGLPGNASLAANWQLAEPEGTITPSGGRAVPARPLPQPGKPVAESRTPDLDGRFRIVDAGSASAPRTAGVEGAVALVSGSCRDLSAAATTLEGAGAAAMVAYAAAGETCAGTFSGDPALPSLEVRPWDARTLLASRGSARIATRTNPGYIYDLVHHFADRVPNGGVVDGTGRAVAAVVETYRGLGSSSEDGVLAMEELVGWVPSRGGLANLGQLRLARFPSTVTHYVSADARWDRRVMMLDATYLGEYASLLAPSRTFPGGSTTRDTWFGGPIGSRVSPLTSLTDGYPPPMREDGWLFLSQGAFTDAAGHYGHSDMYAPEYTGRILVDGQEIWATDWSLFLNEKIADGDHDVVVETRVQRENPFWQLSTDVETRWSFRSEQPTGARAVLPMIGVDYRMDLSATNSAPPGRYRFEVAFSTPQDAVASRIEHRRVEVSWDRGTTWQRLPLSRCEKDACSVTVSNRAGATASLRAEAEDRLGRSVEQTILDAYAVGS